MPTQLVISRFQLHRNRFRGPYELSLLHSRPQNLTSRLLRARYDGRRRDHIGAVGFNLAAATDYLGLTPEQRYAVISEKFPVWLLAEPIVFPRHDLTYGWACRVPGCEAAPTDMQLQFMCWRHTHQYREVKESLSVEEFLGQAKPFHSMLGRGLRRRAGCRIPA